MSVTTTSQSTGEYADQRVDLHCITWDQYITISEALGDRPNPRMIFLDGSLEFLVTSRRHDWYAERLGQLVVAVASGCGINWEDAGTATYQSKDQNAGVEGDKTFYLGAHAVLMRGPVNIDLTKQPPPDLAIEVEVAHSASRAMMAWGRLGVPEVWRFDPEKNKVTFWARQEDGSYAPLETSIGLPVVTPDDVLKQLHLADSLGSSDWYVQLNDWVRATLLPKLEQHD